MPRFLICLFAIALLSGCPPTRDNVGALGSGGSAAWLVVNTIQGTSESTSHSFSWWDGGSNLCRVMQDYYDETSAGYAKYYAQYAAFQERWYTQPYAYSDPDYRRDQCELYRTYYGILAASYAPFSNGRQVVNFNVSHPDSPDGSPIAGTYTIREYGYYYYDYYDYYDNGPYFSANGSLYRGNLYQSYVDAMDCEAYANDPYSSFYPDSGQYQDLLDTFTVTSGNLELTAESDSGWRLSLPDGVQRDEDGVETKYAIDESFRRCDITFEYPQQFF